MLQVEKSRHKLSEIVNLAWPAILQEALNTIVNYIDTAMIGGMGAEASAAVGLTGTVNWLVMSIPGALGIGVLSVAAQANGAGDRETVRKAGQQSVFITIVMGLILTVLCLAVSPFIVAWLGGDELIRADATEYFVITMIPLVFRVANVVFSNALRGVSDMKTPMYANLTMNIVNIVLNFFLIYPSRTVLGISIPGAGLRVTGCAIATAASFVMGGTMMLVAFLRNREYMITESGLHYDRHVMSKCLGIGIPASVKRSIICFGHVAFSSMIAKLGVIPLAAHTIAIQAEQAFYIPGYGFQSAAATLAGNAVGERNKEKLRHLAFTVCLMAATLMFAAGSALFIFSEGLMGIFTPDDAVIRLGASVLKIVAVSEPVYGILVILEGIFDGIGDTKAPVLFSIISMWGIRILGTYLMINLFGLGLEAVWVMMVADNVSRCIMLLVRFLRGRNIDRAIEMNI
ncbi:MAG: MATE family efflux transporter [Christensenellaceae bacterium]|nr:MATE family efflux transporter [Christensenellaceae bacterium]